MNALSTEQIVKNRQNNHAVVRNYAPYVPFQSAYSSCMNKETGKSRVVGETFYRSLDLRHSRTPEQVGFQSNLARSPAKGEKQ